MTYNEQYKKLIQTILTDGIEVEGRNGNTLALPYYSFTIDDMSNDHKLLLRKMYYKGPEGEFKTFIDPTPLTNVKQFEENGCRYWKNWGDEHGNINLDYHQELHPQLEWVMDQVKNNPSSRRNRIELWNWGNVHDETLSLPCCFHGMDFSVLNNKLFMKWSQRSVDTTNGLPSDVYLAYLFMQHVANYANLEIGGCMFSLSNVHIYEENVENATKLLDRTVEDYDKKLEFKLV